MPADEDDQPDERTRRARKVIPRYARGEPQRVAVARNLAEGEMLQGILLEEGIPSILRRTGGFDVPDFLAAGPRDVMVPSSGVEMARGLLGTDVPGAMRARAADRSERIPHPRGDPHRAAGGEPGHRDALVPDPLRHGDISAARIARARTDHLRDVVAPGRLDHLDADAERVLEGRLRRALADSRDEQVAGVTADLAVEQVEH